MEAIVLILVALILCANVAASVAVHRSCLFKNGQKLWQLLLVWGLPVIGAALALYFTIGWRGRSGGDPTISKNVGSADMAHHLMSGRDLP